MTIPAVPPIVGDLDRVVVDVTGKERVDYLDAVLSQRLHDLVPPAATSALELGPHGEPAAVLDMAVLEDRVVLLVPTDQADATVERLAARTFLSEAAFEPREQTATLRVRGDADDVLAAVGVDGEHGDVTIDGDVLWLRWRHGADVVAPTTEVERIRTALVDAGAEPARAEELDAAEIAAGVPRAPEEITRGRLPEELGLLPTHVHLDKGCYPGQEAVARMWMLGRPRRRLAIVALPDDIPAGHVVDDPGAAEVTRTARIDEHTIGLAFVGRDVTPGDTPHEGVEVLALVGDGLPVPGHDPSVQRRRDR